MLAAKLFTCRYATAAVEVTPAGIMLATRRPADASRIIHKFPRHIHLGVISSCVYWTESLNVRATTAYPISRTVGTPGAFGLQPAVNGRSEYAQPSYCNTKQRSRHVNKYARLESQQDSNRNIDETV